MANYDPTYVAGSTLTFLCPKCYPKYGAVPLSGSDLPPWECQICGWKTYECWPGSGCFHQAVPNDLMDQINGDNMYWNILEEKTDGTASI